MIAQENLEKIKKAVHQPLNWEDYNSTSVVENTNCFSHAIGSTVTSDKSAYSLGMISGKRKLESGYVSKDEVSSLFISDLSVIGLDMEEIPFESLSAFLENIPKIDLANNEHIVALFVKEYRKDDIIRYFHFLRYDKERGWSEKRWNRKVCFFEDISREWPSDWNDRLIGVFKVTR